jgi:hypothetical protein
VTENEKRGSIRFKPKSGSHIVYPEGSGGIRDLSLSGMYVVDPDPLPEGSGVSFALRLGINDIQLHGIVTRSEPGKGMVIQFTDLSRESTRRLRIYIAGLIPAPGAAKKH